MSGKQVIRELVTKWSFDVDKTNIKAGDKAVANLKKGFAVAAAAGVGLVATFGAIVKKTAETIDATGKLAQGYGVTAQTVAELNHAFGLAGLTQDDVSKSFKKLSQNTFEATEGNKKMRDAFGLLNIDVDKFSKIPVDKRLEVLADSLAGIDDPAKRAALRITLLGRSGSEMGPLLDKGSKALRAARDEAKKLGVSITALDVKNAEKMNDDIARLKLEFSAFTTQVAIEAMPTVIEFVNTLREGFAKNKGAIKNFLKNIKEVVAALGGLKQIARITGIVIGLMVAGKVAAGFISFIQVLKAVRLGYIALKTSAIAAQVAALALPLAIVGAIAAIGLLIEDWIVFKEGGNSAIGQVVAKFPELKAAIETIDTILDTSKAWFDTWAEVWKATTGRAIFAVIDLYENVSAYISFFVPVFQTTFAEVEAVVFGVVDRMTNKFIDFVKTAADLVSKIPGIDVGGVSDIANSLIGGASEIGSNARQQRTEATRRAAETGGAGRGNRVEIRTENRSEYNITQLPGESGEDLANRINRHQDEREDRQARKIAEDTAAAYAY